MPIPYKVKVTIVSIAGECPLHKVGESWLIEEDKTPGGVCTGAYYSIAPRVETLRSGGEFYWAQDKDIIRLACPDPKNPVVFELRRLRD